MQTSMKSKFSNKKKKYEKKGTANCWICVENSKLFYKQITKKKRNKKKTKKYIHKMREKTKKKQNQKAAINKRNHSYIYMNYVVNYPCLQYDWDAIDDDVEFS